MNVRVWMLWLLLFVAMPASADAPIAWTEQAADGSVKVKLFFFWSSTCPHCRHAKPFVEDLTREYPWLELHAYQVNGDPEGARLYVQMAQWLGQDAKSVPAFMYCGRMEVGYDGVGHRLRENLQRCHRLGGSLSASDLALAEKEDLPFGLDAGAMSLPLLTLILAGLDAFNPCAFFVLFFLLSLLVQAKSRARMLLIGGVFVVFSGLVYFLFMAAWLNVFLVAGQMAMVTVAAGVVALLFGVINIKDFFWFKAGISLSIPDSARPTLFARMRASVNAESLPAMLVATTLLALAANSYELLCTAGFPMVFTRTLTMHELSPWTYYGYLALYNVIYVIPLMVIVSLFAWTMSSHKLTEREGRSLKLMSGIMMAGFGVILLFFPDAMTDLWVLVGLIGAALAAAVGGHVLMRVR